MLKRSLVLTLVVLGAAVSAVSPRAQMRPRPVADETGDVKLQLLFRKLHSVGTFMMTIAHPDDENNALLAEMSYGNGLRTVAVTATRGDGGQNEIGPEIFDALAVLRSEELLAAHRFDGAEEYFTRAVDFGYSFSIDETYDKWGKDQIISDYVRHIRTIRPDVVVGFLWDGTGGGQHHQASTHITAEAFRAAADPARYPEQIKEGLHPWQAKKFYYTGGAGGGRGGGAAPATSSVVVQPVTSTYDPVLGRTYDEIGVEARSMHKCQGTSQLLALPGAGGGRGNAYTREDVAMANPPAREQSMLDGVDVSWMSLVQFAGANAPGDLATTLRAIDTDVSNAEAAFKSGGNAASVAGLAAGLHQLRALRQSVAQSSISADGKYEIDFRLDQKEHQFEDALLTAADVRIEAVGTDPVVTPGQSLRISLIAANRGRTPVTVTSMATAGFATTPPCQVRDVAPGTALTCASEVQIPLTAQPTDITFRHDPTAGARYIFKPGVPFGVPFAPTPFRGDMAFVIGGEAAHVDLPIEARYSDSVAGEKRSELLVAPALTLTVTPDVVVVPTGAAVTREVRVIVRNNSNGAESGTVRLKVPAGWSVDPATAAVTVAREDEEATARFIIKPPSGTRPGDAAIDAEVTSGSATYTTGYQVVEYPHTHKRFLFHPAEAALKLVDVKVAPNLKVGYIMGAGDRVPEAIQQLGVSVSMIGTDELAWGDLSKYSVIMLGVRAYDKRADLRANNQRVLDYARNGGVVLLNYARTEFNLPQGFYGPFPGTTTSERTTDENAPMTILVPDHPVFNTPNKIGPAAWANWVQERGTYYFRPGDPQYVDLLQSEDPFPYNAGPKRGILVDAKVGKGRWMYIGLVLWRELPAGVPGAYQILANLLSLGAPGK